MNHNLTELIGNTPLLQLGRLSQQLQLRANIIAKLEYLNPARSVKDRTALALITPVRDKKVVKKVGNLRYFLYLYI